MNPSSRADLWGVGGVILYWDHLAYEHYTAGLEDGRTHLIVNVTSAKAAAERVLSDEALAVGCCPAEALFYLSSSSAIAASLGRFCAGHNN